MRTYDRTLTSGSQVHCVFECVSLLITKGTLSENSKQEAKTS